MPSGYQFLTNGLQTLTGAKTFINLPILPSGYDFLTTGTQTISGLKTMSSLLSTTGVTDTVSITSPSITGSTIVNGGTFSASNIAGTSSFYGVSVLGTSTFNNFYPTTTLGNNLSTNTTQFATVGYVNTNGGTALLSSANTWTNTNFFTQLVSSSSVSSPYYTSPSGGISRWYSPDNHQFGQIFSNNTYNLFVSPAYKLSLLMNASGASNSGGVNPTDTQGCDIGWSYSGQGSTDFYNNAGLQGTTTHQAFSFWDASTVLVQQAIAYIPRIQSAYSSTGLNIPTYDWVNGTISSVSPNLLPLNNQWTGTNSFTQQYISVGNSTPVTIGNGIGNIRNTNIGDPSSLSTISTVGNNICISTPISGSMYNTTGSSNICVGGSSASSLTSGNSNTFIGSGCGQTITTGSNNTIVGAGAWSTGGNFSNCTVIGINAPAPFSNNSIILGSTTETVYINGASQLNNTLLYGTTVASNNFQVNGNIILPIQNFTAGVTTTFTILPPFVFFTPAPSGMGFIWPLPSASNAGQTFTIRRIAPGSGLTINNTIVGNVALWFTTNSGTGISNIAISTVWSFTFISNGSGYYQIG